MKYHLIYLLFLTHFLCFSSPRITVKKEFENVILFYDGNTNNEEYVKLEFIAKRVLLLSKQFKILCAKMSVLMVMKSMVNPAR